MSIFELIGLIIAFFSFFYMMSSHKGQPEKERRRARAPAYDGDDEEEDPLIKLLATFEQKSVKKKKQGPQLSTPIQKRKAEKQHHLHSVKAQPPSPIQKFEDRSYKEIQPHQGSRAKKMIRTLRHMQNLVVYQEIMGKPIGLRSQEWQ